MPLALLWIPATLVAALAQTARNALQRSLTGALGTVGATQVRFLYGLPFSLVFVALVLAASGESPPAIGAAGLAWAVAGALSQIAATALMLLAMQARSFAVATAIIKTEPVLVAILGIVALGEAPSRLGGAGILVATAGVVLISVRPGFLREKGEFRPILLGVIAGGCFALSAVGFRGAILALPTGSPALRASTVLVLGLAIQTATLMAWMLLFDRGALAASFKVWRRSLLAGFLGAFASQFWFLGFSLTAAANVRTLALVEVLFAQAVSGRVFRQAASRRELAGMALIVAGVALLLAGAA